MRISSPPGGRRGSSRACACICESVRRPCRSGSKTAVMAGSARATRCSSPATGCQANTAITTSIRASTSTGCSTIRSLPRVRWRRREPSHAPRRVCDRARARYGRRRRLYPRTGSAGAGWRRIASCCAIRTTEWRIRSSGSGRSCRISIPISSKSRSISATSIAHRRSRAQLPPRSRSPSKCAAGRDRASSRIRSSPITRSKWSGTAQWLAAGSGRARRRPRGSKSACRRRRCSRGSTSSRCACQSGRRPTTCRWSTFRS